MRNIDKSSRSDGYFSQFTTVPPLTALLLLGSARTFRVKSRRGNMCIAVEISECPVKRATVYGVLFGKRPDYRSVAARRINQTITLKLVLLSVLSACRRVVRYAKLKKKTFLTRNSAGEPFESLRESIILYSTSGLNELFLKCSTRSPNWYFFNLFSYTFNANRRTHVDVDENYCKNVYINR